MAQIFEQQTNESAKAFEAFSLYLNMGAERSLAAVGRKLGKSEGLIERWSSRFSWPERVLAHASHLAIAEREATEALARLKAAEWGKRQQELREKEWALHEKCIAAAERGLAAYMEREKVYANLADIARMLEVASKLGRLATGMATDKADVAHEHDGTVRVEVRLALEKIYGEPLPGEVVDVQTAEMNSRLPVADSLGGKP